jgi:4-hydroxybenzoate polyprenyltransferase
LFSELLDLRADRLAGRRTTALLIGPAAAKYLLSLFLLVESILVSFALRDWRIAAFFAFGAVWFFVDALWLFGAKSYSQRLLRCFFVAWNIIVLGSICYLPRLVIPGNS